jgi:uncharacterized protein DUF4424
MVPGRHARPKLSPGWWVLALVLSFCGRASANDSASELAAGGLVLVKNDAIAIQREDLTLAPSEVRVRYEMRNDTGRPVSLRVAFPLPEVPKETPGGMETKTAYNIAMQPVTEPNFLGFRVWSDGQEVQPEEEIRATLPDGRDVTEAVRQIGGLRLVLHPRMFTLPIEPAERTGPYGGWDLDATMRDRLRQLGLLEQEDEAYDLLWTTRITFHWTQTFRPGVTVLEHRYRPIVGGHVFVVPAGRPLERAEVERYCIDAATERAIRSFARRFATSGEPATLIGYTLAYVLKTAQNWAARSARFT